MRIKVVNRTHWKSFFDRISKEVQDRLIDLELASPEIGDQIEESLATLNGLSYDPISDILTILTDHADHWLQSPHQVRVFEGNGEVESIGIKAESGQVMVLHFSRQLALPQSSSGQRHW